MTPNEERAYEDGRRAALVTQLYAVLYALGVDDPDAARVRWLQEREATVAALRSLCRDCGDNDWPDNLYLPDVIDKHLANYLESDSD